MGDFSIDIAQVRKNAEKDVKYGAVVADYKAASGSCGRRQYQSVCVLRYLQNARNGTRDLGGGGRSRTSKSMQEKRQTHAERNQAVGGKPDLIGDSFTTFPFQHGGRKP